MSQQSLDAKLLSQCFLSGAKALEAKKEIINELNVFPVPDGDTGTNMTLTIMSAAKDVYALGDAPEMGAVCKAMSSGSLKGARGNSGVILSQLLRGFTKVVKEAEVLDIPLLTTAFEKAVESAYKAVMKPKEGTILSVARAMGEKATALNMDGVSDLTVFFEQVIAAGEEMLAYTPELLPVLKEAGVVDSGGQGLLEFMKGAFQAFNGNPIPFEMEETGEKTSENAISVSSEGKNYSFSWKFVAKKSFDAKSQKELSDVLEAVCEQVHVSIEGENITVSGTSDDPGIALQKCIKLGQVIDIDIKNIKYVPNQQEVSQVPEEPVSEERIPYGFIAVAAGEGMTELFKSLGVHQVISGGQTMNPSTEDFLNAIDALNADVIYIMPNNKNIIMAANQARDLVENKKVFVIPTTTMPQAVTAMINFVPSVSDEENKSAMAEAVHTVKTGSITYAVRDTVIEGAEIHKDDYMAVGDSGILSNGKNLEEVMTEMLQKMVDDTTELISIYYGADVSDEDANAMNDFIQSQYGDLDIELQNGGQSVYYYIVSAE